ncbi:MAG: cyclic lactone autoinducer peptide [Lachnospiraceae bacterium]|nr:cyclic lactone autoinducer peptide [Lachnospiraceae bacterium]
MKRQAVKSVAKGIKSALDVVLRTEANTASCAIMYQPKAPQKLMKYRRNK